MTKVPLPYVLVRACPCLSTTYASPNFRAFLTCRAPENWKSHPEAATSTPTNPRSRCTTKSTTIQALSSLLVGNATRLFACRVGAHDEISRVCQLHGECNLPQLADCAVSDTISNHPCWLLGFAQTALFRCKPYSSATQYKYIDE